MTWFRGKEGVRSFTSDTAQDGSLAQHHAGVHEIPVEAVVGSVGRSHELRSDFMPRHEPHGDERYRRVRRAMLRGACLPPIEVYKLRDSYYVLDGNHRVAAAKAMGQMDIDAVVIEFEVVSLSSHRAAAA